MQRVSFAHVRLKREVKEVMAWTKKYKEVQIQMQKSGSDSRFTMSHLSKARLRHCHRAWLLLWPWRPQIQYISYWKWIEMVFWTAMSCSEWFQGENQVPRIYGAMQTMGFLSSTCVQRYEVPSTAGHLRDNFIKSPVCHKIEWPQIDPLLQSSILLNDKAQADRLWSKRQKITETKKKY